MFKSKHTLGATAVGVVAVFAAILVGSSHAGAPCDATLPPTIGPYPGYLCGTYYEGEECDCCCGIACRAFCGEFDLACLALCQRNCEEWEGCHIGGTGSPLPPPDGDINADGVLDLADLVEILGAWGPNPGHPADLNDDNTVDVLDVLDWMTSL